MRTQHEGLSAGSERKGSPRPERGRMRGMTLIEMMVGLLIAMMLSLAVFAVMGTAESRKRAMTSVNDLNQAGDIALYLIDRWVRSAGSGVTQAAAYTYGCALHAARAGNQLLPLRGPLPRPFDGVDPALASRFAPVLILPGQSAPGASGRRSDVLVVMGGAGGQGEAPVPFTEPARPASLKLLTGIEFGAGDMLLLSDRSAAGGSRCMLQQVASGFTPAAGSTLPLGGAYHAAQIGGLALDSFSEHASAVNLGSATGPNPPSFLLLGVGEHNALQSYDLLATRGGRLQAQAEGVFELHALYGVDTRGDGTVGAWVSPDSGEYAATALADGSAAAAERLRRIKALRVGLILRTSQPEKAAVSDPSLKLFADLGALVRERALSNDERRFRYRTLEATIPLRNNMLAD